MSSINLVTMNLAGKSLDALWTRANVITDNIANADTPGYTQKDVEFESLLQTTLKDGTLSNEQVQNLEPKVVSSVSTPDENGNSVDMEKEMIDLSRNQLQYNYMKRAISDQLIMMRNAASEGKG